MVSQGVEKKDTAVDQRRDLRLLVVQEIIMKTLGLDRSVITHDGKGEYLLLSKEGKTVKLSVLGGHMYAEVL